MSARDGTSGNVYGVAPATGAQLWSGSTGTGLTPTDEHNAVIRTGIAVADGMLLVPAGPTLTVFTN